EEYVLSEPCSGKYLAGFAAFLRPFYRSRIMLRRCRTHTRRARPCRPPNSKDCQEWGNTPMNYHRKVAASMRNRRRCRGGYFSEIFEAHPEQVFDFLHQPCEGEDHD